MTAEAGSDEGALSAPPSSGVGRSVRRIEHGFLILALLAAAALPLADTLGRPFGVHVPAGADYLQQVVLWLAFLGGLVATREKRHLSLSTAELFGEGSVRRAGRVLAGAVSAATGRRCNEPVFAFSQSLSACTSARVWEAVSTAETRVMSNPFRARMRE